MDSTYGASYETLYHQHWWWRSRERILLNEIERLALPDESDILDVGCGNGLFLDRLSTYGNVRGIEVDADLLDPSNPYRPRIQTEPLGHADYEDWQCDLITACDVIEHIEDDRFAVTEMCRMLKPGGFLMITVPAFTALWDTHDEINHHFRRYHYEQLTALLSPQLKLLTCRYLFPSLFLPKLAVKLWNFQRSQAVPQHAMPARWINRAAAGYCYAEYQLTRYAPPAFGTSLLAIGRKS